MEGVAKSFGRGPGDRVIALDGIDLSISEAEFVTILGPSGCGKTTLLRVIAGFEEPDTGSIHLAGRQVAGVRNQFLAAHERGIGLVPQEGALFPHLSVAQNVAFGLKRMPAAERKARVRQTLELVGLEGYAKRRPHELSGGQQQRVALARAMAPRPSVILLDEPFSALDAYLRDSLRLEIRELLRSQGTTVVLVTHDQEEALSLGDRVVVMRDGRIVQADIPHEVYYRPKDMELARFLGNVVAVDGRVEQGGGPAQEVTCPFGLLPISSWHGGCGLCQVMIRPENIKVLPLACPVGLEQGLVGTIRDQTFYGHDGILRVQVPELGEDVQVRISGDQPYALGEQVRLIVERRVATYAK